MNLSALYLRHLWQSLGMFATEQFPDPDSQVPGVTNGSVRKASVVCTHSGVDMQYRENLLC